MSGLAGPLVHALVAFAWQGAVLALLFALAQLAARTSRARYAAACLALAAMPLVFAATLAAAFAAALGAREPALAALVPIPAAARPVTAAQAVALAWLIGVVVMLARLGGGAWRVRRLVARAAPATAALRRRALSIARRAGAPLRTAVRVSAEIAVPCAWGVLRPVVLVPAWVLTGMPPAQLDALLAHELIHLRRGDVVVALLQEVVVALFFFHPAAWWLAHRARALREECCDDAVAALYSPLDYARALAALEASRPGALAGLAASGGSLVNRIRRLLDPARRIDHASAGRSFTDRSLTRGRAAKRFVPGVLTGVVVLTALAGLVAGLAWAASPAPIRWLPPQLVALMPALDDAATRHGLDPRFLAVVALCESNGNPRAVSPTGARGLLQLMPATAEKIARERGLPGHRVERLDDVPYNADLGAWFLARAFQEFAPGRTDDDAIALVAAAYNAGPEALRASLGAGAPLRDETILYQRCITSLWRERDDATSPSYEAFKARWGAR